MIVSDSCIVLSDVVFFFFQAEDGIRDVAVTGVQTCALPISLRFPRYASSTSCAVWGRNSSRNQARALRNTGSRRRSYSLSSRSALSYLVVTGGSVGMTSGSYRDACVAATQALQVSSAAPTVSCCWQRTHGIRSSRGSSGGGS